MATTEEQERTPAIAGPLTSVFDWGHWPLSRGRLAGAACAVAFAVALCAAVGSLRAMGVFVLLETLLLALPWRLPRTERSAVGFWTETVCGLLGPLGAIAVAVWNGAAWLREPGEPAWYVAGAALGGVLLWLGGMNLRALATGELSFLAGPTRPAHGYARATAIIVGPFGEEALYRGTALTAASAVSTPVALPLGLLAAVAFVARHHIAPGANGRDSTRAMGVEVSAAALLLALTLLSHSVWPALLAHLINNIPSAVLQIQCARSGRADTP
ncbi:type II CAAX prenyl endopeptidase Rce1 family protein [Streptomyces sp. NPDC059597]|uniref:CPBP family glutamic-type intramembrane protease n=1 Tax=Streptomyces sp. NPDC059597 TaxID=3346879 RepID=UPI0036858F9B